jgi:hypothetical protein
LRFLLRHALTLEGGLGLRKGGPLLLELSLRLLARTPLLLELLPHLGKRGDLLRQADPQPLNLLGFLLSLTLPGPRPLEGCAILLELGSSGSKLRLELRPAARSSRACDASSRSRSADVTFSIAEASSATWAP